MILLGGPEILHTKEVLWGYTELLSFPRNLTHKSWEASVQIHNQEQQLFCK